jgi:hypothetical protein
MPGRLFALRLVAILTESALLSDQVRRANANQDIMETGFIVRRPTDAHLKTTAPTIPLASRMLLRTPASVQLATPGSTAMQKLIIAPPIHA